MLRVNIGGVLICLGLVVAGVEGPGCPGIINLVGLIVFIFGGLVIIKGGKNGQNKSS